MHAGSIANLGSLVDRLHSSLGDNLRGVLLAIVIVLVLRWVWRRWDQIDFIAPHVGMLFGQNVQELRVTRDARRAEKMGDWSGAGMLYEELGQLERALDCYEKAGEFDRCGEICLQMRRKDYAAEWFLLGSDKVRAARLFQELGKPGRAAQVYLEAGQKLEAAAAFGRAGDFARAGELYSKAGYYLKAGVAYESAGDSKRAAELFERQLSEVGGGAQGFMTESQRAEMARLSARAARGFQKAGEGARAAAILEAGGQYGLAASVWEKLGEHRRAADLYRRAGQMEKAAEMFRLAGDPRSAAELEGEHHLSTGDQRAAAECFLKSGDPMRAAEIFEGLGEYGRAAVSYERAGAFAYAADAALRAGDKAAAARFFEGARQFDRAADLRLELGEHAVAAKYFAESGRYFEAAKAAAAANDDASLVEYLQQVPPDDEHYLDAVKQLAGAFVRRGWAAIAIEKLKTVLGQQEPRADNLELWDILARAYETEGELERAATVLHKIMAIQYNYPSAEERYVALQRNITARKDRPVVVLTESTGSESLATGDGAARNGHRYELRGRLGKGGMGSVYRAYDTLLKRTVAYKILSSQLAKHPEARRQLLSEAQAAAALNHPNIVTLFDLGFDGDQPFICMELVDGENVAAILRRRKRFSVAETMHLLVSSCQGLDHAHRRGVIHRDLKPSNLLLTTENEVKIVDFGLAELVTEKASAEEREDASPSMSGTPKYVSPEQARGGPTDARSDIYSLGATIYEMLVGHAPFTEGNLLLHHLYTPVPPPRKERPEIPTALEELLLLCLGKHPDERFQSTGEMLAFVSAAKLA